MSSPVGRPSWCSWIYRVFHKSRTKLGDYMNRQVTSSVADVDLIVFVTEANRPLNEAEKKLIASFRGMPAVAVLNKIDLLDAPERCSGRSPR